MSLIAAIDAAVRLELASENVVNYNDYLRVMGPGRSAQAAQAAQPAQDAIDGLGLDVEKLEIFLQKVARRLKFDTPSLNYDWTKTATAKCLLANRETLIEMIAAATTEMTAPATTKQE